jgi:DNA-binding HxlR family transcriptional regulator
LLDKIKQELESLKQRGKMRPVKTYDQYCAAAKALDVVGDRWTLLIVRELLIRQPLRYTDLRYGLPGIATNLLADRLRDLEAHGVITRELAPPPIAATVFRLTPRGEALKPVLVALGEWGAPMLADSPDDITFRSHWLALPLELKLVDTAPDQPPVTIEVRTADQPVLVETADGRVRVRPGTATAPDAALSGPPPLVASLLIGRIDLDTARARGLEFEGDPDALRRVQPAAVPA